MQLPKTLLRTLLLFWAKLRKKPGYTVAQAEFLRINQLRAKAKAEQQLFIDAFSTLLKTGGAPHSGIATNTFNRLLLNAKNANSTLINSLRALEVLPENSLWLERNLDLAEHVAAMYSNEYDSALKLMFENPDAIVELRPRLLSALEKQAALQKEVQKLKNELRAQYGLRAIDLLTAV